MNKDLESIMRDAELNEEQMRFTGAAISHCAHQLAQQGRVPLQAMILTNPQDGSEPGLIMLACPLLEDQETKKMFMETVRYMAHQERSETVGILMEAWTAPEMSNDEFAKMIEQHGSISKMPGAGEAACVMVNSDAGDHQASMMIGRDEDGNIIDLSDIKIVTAKEGDMRGMMMHSRYAPEEIADPSFHQRIAFMEAYLSGRMTDLEPVGEGGPTRQ